MEFLSFKGTADKSEFWKVFRIIFILSFIVQLFGGFLQKSYMERARSDFYNASQEQQQLYANAVGTVFIEPSEKISMTISIICVVLSLLMIPTYVRRLHDRNKSGLFMFIALIPILGGLYLLLDCGFGSSVDVGNKYLDEEFDNAPGFGGTSMDARFDALYK